MYDKNELNNLYREIATSIDISEEMFDSAVTEYQALGKWIDEHTPSYEICIYPQGSFGLGTVVKPITDSDDYDLDLVCQFSDRYGLSARQLKLDVVKPLLVSYKKTSKDIENKRRCWHVEYEDIPQFHMDIIPAYAVAKSENINITDHNEELDMYQYIGSNPSGYIKWFFKRCAKQRERLLNNYIQEHRLVVASADIEDLKRRKIKTPLQRVVQLLKRHRDVMFASDETGCKPISIIITTMAASLYQEEDNIVDALTNILQAAPSWIMENKRNGQYFIENPSYKGENFADKWNTHSDRAAAFFDWLQKAREDLVGKELNHLTRIEMGSRVQKSFGVITGKAVFSKLAQQEQAAIKEGSLRVDTKAGTFSTSGNVVVPHTRHYGE